MWEMCQKRRRGCRSKTAGCGFSPSTDRSRASMWRASKQPTLYPSFLRASSPKYQLWLASKHSQDGAPRLFLGGSGPRVEDRSIGRGSAVGSIQFKGRQIATNLMASSKTLLRFRWVKAEHSRYLTALISLATDRACSYDTGSIFFALRLSAVPLSSRKSNLVPTRMIGTLGAWCSISGYHSSRGSGSCGGDGVNGDLPLL